MGLFVVWLGRRRLVVNFVLQLLLVVLVKGVWVGIALGGRLSGEGGLEVGLGLGDSLMVLLGLLVLLGVAGLGVLLLRGMSLVVGGNVVAVVFVVRLLVLVGLFLFKVRRRLFLM